MHRFFETNFVLQEPSYSSIYPLGQGIVLAKPFTNSTLEFNRVLAAMPFARANAIAA